MTNLFGITDVNSVVRDCKPYKPTLVFKPQAMEKAVRCFIDGFKGKVLYAVKTNPAPHALQCLYENGIRNFDVASLGEVELVYNLLPGAKLHFMHTVKSRHAIREAYHTYGVRDFSLDSEHELQKIMEETGYAKDLNLFVRLAISNEYAELSLSGKFGVSMIDAKNLIIKTRQYANKLGICFHVGSQCMHPDAYRIAMRVMNKVVTESRATIDMLDVGGGFPSIYPGMKPLAMQLFFDAIHEEFEDIKQGRDIELLCEPGRALVAESGSVIVRVELRKGDHLYINDGTYGSLFDAGTPNFVFPVKLIRPDGNVSENTSPFSLFGPTCDSLDYMKGPFHLPEDIEEGDYIEIGQLGAYGGTMSTRFNGFDHNEQIYRVSDEPLMTMYGDEFSDTEPTKMVAA
ncbi:MAG: ornithine decarboxylase [Rickettsiaceae bacterium]|jgi:ornithine decarboxylase|nr:ornithine decarboxylase [Rickettsiaceae bacterium]